MIKFNVAFFVVFFIFLVAFGNVFAGQIVITGDEMEIKRSEELVISKGNSRAANNTSLVVADKLLYDKTHSILSASGNVKLFSKTEIGETFEAYGSFAEYNINSQKGKIWGERASIKYHKPNLNAPFILYAREIYVFKKAQILSAYNNVVVTTSFGIIYADNGIFNRKTFDVTFKKDKKRPVADIYYDGKKYLYEADEMIFYNTDDNIRIVMNGSVVGKIEIEDKINDIKNRKII